MIIYEEQKKKKKSITARIQNLTQNDKTRQHKYENEMHTRMWKLSTAQKYLVNKVKKQY